MVPRTHRDWKAFAGFSGLLLLIIFIGLLGIRQIQNLSKVVTELAKSDIPLQNAVLEMKSANSKYAMGIRNYVFWRGSKYLDAAAIGERLNMVESESRNFDRHLEFYSSLATTASQREWTKNLRSGEKQLRAIGSTIIDLAARMDEAADDDKASLEESINRQLMVFENTLFKIDAYLENPIQRNNLETIARWLATAESGKRKSIIFLSWSLLIGLLLGAQTAFLIQRRSKREREHREMLWRAVIRVEEEERNNLSLQIHDQMGQDLSAIKIYLGLIDRELPPEAVEEKDRIAKAKGIIDELMGKAHNISELLRPPELDDLGLSESIASLVDEFREMTDIQFTYERPPADVRLLPEFSLVLYRVVQEALTNVAKHSQAKHVSIVFERRKDSAYLSVCDDGVGFDYEDSTQKPHRRREDRVKMGLAGLKERIELLGGRLVVKAQPGQGTRLEVELPTVTPIDASLKEKAKDGLAAA